MTVAKPERRTISVDHINDIADSVVEARRTDRFDQALAPTVVRFAATVEEAFDGQEAQADILSWQIGLVALENALSSQLQNDKEARHLQVDFVFATVQFLAELESGDSTIDSETRERLLPYKTQLLKALQQRYKQELEARSLGLEGLLDELPELEEEFAQLDPTDPDKCKNIEQMKIYLGNVEKEVKEDFEVRSEEATANILRGSLDAGEKIQLGTLEEVHLVDISKFAEDDDFKAAVEYIEEKINDPDLKAQLRSILDVYLLHKIIDVMEIGGSDKFSQVKEFLGFATEAAKPHLTAIIDHQLLRWTLSLGADDKLLDARIMADKALDKSDKEKIRLALNNYVFLLAVHYAFDKGDLKETEAKINAYAFDQEQGKPIYKAMYRVIKDDELDQAGVVLDDLEEPPELPAQLALELPKDKPGETAKQVLEKDQPGETITEEYIVERLTKINTLGGIAEFLTTINGLIKAKYLAKTKEIVNSLNSRTQAASAVLDSQEAGGIKSYWQAAKKEIKASESFIGLQRATNIIKQVKCLSDEERHLVASALLNDFVQIAQREVWENDTLEEAFASAKLFDRFDKGITKTIEKALATAVLTRALQLGAEGKLAEAKELIDAYGQIDPEVIDPEEAKEMRRALDVVVVNWMRRADQEDIDKDPEDFAEYLSSEKVGEQVIRTVP